MVRFKLVSSSEGPHSLLVASRDGDYVSVEELEKLLGLPIQNIENVLGSLHTLLQQAKPRRKRVKTSRSVGHSTKRR